MHILLRILIKHILFCCDYFIPFSENFVAVLKRKRWNILWQFSENDFEYTYVNVASFSRSEIAPLLYESLACVKRFTGINSVAVRWRDIRVFDNNISWIAYPVTDSRGWHRATINIMYAKWSYSLVFESSCSNINIKNIYRNVCCRYIFLQTLLLDKRK